MTDAPLTQEEFDRLLDRLRPFETAPHLAVAVSGGADSFALALLADRWARPRHGRVTALIVDHGLRPDSAAEARTVARWLAAHGVRRRILAWRGPKPATNIAAAARAARYALLRSWCREAGVVHLLLGHQRDDQAETMLLRLARGSGLDGLASMPDISELAHVRLLRPLLSVPRERLRALLTARRQSWIEDPTNVDPAYARARVRAMGEALAAEGLTRERLAETAGNLGRARAAIEVAVAAVLAEAATIDPAGYCALDVAALGRAPEEVSLRALAAVLATVSGAEYPPRFDRLRRLHREVVEARRKRALTLGGCLVLPNPAAVLIVREPAAIAAPVRITVPGTALEWDGRYHVCIGRRDGSRADLVLGALGADGRAEINRLQPELKAHPIPSSARASLPAIRDRRGVLLVPHLGYRRPNARAASVPSVKLVFTPARPLTGAGFAVV